MADGEGQNFGIQTDRDKGARGSVIGWLKCFSYRPWVSRLVWRLHLAAPLRRVYYWLNRPPGGILQVDVGGVTARFRVFSPWHLRSLEPAGGLGHEQHVLEKFLSRLRPDDVVYDIGSNYGIYAVLVAQRVGLNGKVIAFEPDSEAFEHLEQNLRLNSLVNVRPFRLALGDDCRKAQLFLGEFTGDSSLVGPRVGRRGAEEVEVIEGDRMVERERLPIPREVKIDVEGNEFAVIHGLRRTLARPECELVCCEVHPQLLPDGKKPEQVIDLLKSLGFAQTEVYERGSTEFHVFAHKG